MVLKNASKIEQKTNVSMVIEKIYVRNLTKTRDINTAILPLTTDIHSIISNSEIDIICECMGGNAYLETKEYLKIAIRNKKHIIMSSKKTLANFAQELLTIANNENVHLKYDASVGGGIPIAKVLETAYQGEKIISQSCFLHILW